MAVVVLVSVAADFRALSYLLPLLLNIVCHSIPLHLTPDLALPLYALYQQSLYPSCCQLHAHHTALQSVKIIEASNLIYTAEPC